MLQKIQLILKKGSNKNYSELNFLQKTLWVHTSIPSRSGCMVLQRLLCVKYWNGKVKFTLWLNAAKNTAPIKKVQIKIVRNSIYYKKT